MSRRRRIAVVFAGSAWTLLLIGACGGGGAKVTTSTSTALGQALPGLSAGDQKKFADGLAEFVHSEDQNDGLGPVFNGTSCGECHVSGAPGGAGINLTRNVVTRIGGRVGGVYTDMPELGGPVLQSRSLQEFVPGYPIPPEAVPAGAEYVSRRFTTPLFGLGLIEAIPDATILAEMNKPQPDGVHGVANMVVNPDNGATEVGRFGWKAQRSTIHAFAGDAYLNEMGITNPTFPNENLPQGKPIPPGADVVADPEDDGTDVQKFTDFMRFLAPPNRKLTETAIVQRGEQVFDQIHCTACHVPSLQTGPNAIAALSNQTVHLYSDLLLHQMGAGLTDGIEQYGAKGDQFRTAPLWGLSRRSFYLHDGRASSIEDAVSGHGGEASAAARRFASLSSADRAAILAFLNSL